jgi:hypothetical protein
LPSLSKISRVGQGVKTPPFHGGITGSNPVRGTMKAIFEVAFLIILNSKTPAICTLTILTNAFFLVHEFGLEFDLSRKSFQMKLKGAVIETNIPLIANSVELFKLSLPKFLQF